MISISQRVTPDALFFCNLFHACNAGILCSIRHVYLLIIAILFGLEDINACFCVKNISRMEIIRRQQYIDHTLSIINKGMMLVLVGQRRVGKSYILLDLSDQYPKYVVSMDPVGGEVDGYPGINHVRLREFLKMKF